MNLTNQIKYLKNIHKLKIHCKKLYKYMNEHINDDNYLKIRNEWRSKESDLFYYSVLLINEISKRYNDDDDVIVYEDDDKESDSIDVVKE